MARTKHPRFITSLLAGAAALAMLSVGMAPASASAVPATTGSSAINYVNLGDSYSAGFGSGSIIEPTPGCFQATGPDHVSMLAAGPKVNLLVNAACAGFTSAQVRTAATAVAPYLAKADLVTLTMGGNDLHYSTVIGACSTQGTAKLCDRAILATLLNMPQTAKSANKTLRTIDAATPGRILLLGYPRLLSPEFGDNPLITAKRATQLNQLTDLLNVSLAASTRGTDARFVSVTSRFKGHGIGSPDSWMYFNPMNPADPFNLHPTETGYQFGYYPALKARVDALRLVH